MRARGAGSQKQKSADKERKSSYQGQGELKRRSDRSVKSSHGKFSVPYRIGRLKGRETTPSQRKSTGENRSVKKRWNFQLGRKVPPDPPPSNRVRAQRDPRRPRALRRGLTGIGQPGAGKPNAADQSPKRGSFLRPRANPPARDRPEPLGIGMNPGTGTQNVANRTVRERSSYPPRKRLGP